LIRVPPGLADNPRHDPVWADWIAGLPAAVAELAAEWGLSFDDAEPMHGVCAIVVPVRTEAGRAAVLKVGFPHIEAELEHLALRHWAGAGAVELLRADPHRSALLLERLQHEDLTDRWDLEACEIVGGLYGRLHIPAPPQLRRLPDVIAPAVERLRDLDAAAVPRRMVEQAGALGAAFVADPGSAGTLIHTDLHYTNVLATPSDHRSGEPWLAIDPKPLSGDPHYELAPMLWNRWDELAGQVRAGVRRRFDTLVDVAGLDEDRARAWAIVRMVLSAAEVAAHPPTPAAREWLTTCVAVAKAVGS
jgi:streptomycin 6-kinase